jgi:TetR/AcrR family transcriptional regulator
MAFVVEYPVISQFSESFLREKSSRIYEKALSVHNFVNNDDIMKLIEQAYERGELRSDLPVVFMQKMIAYLFTHAADLADLSKAEQIEFGIDCLVDFIQFGLAKQPC